MPDLYSSIHDVEPEIQERLAEVLEMRAADPRQKEMLHAYLSEIDFPTEAQVLEIGCGTGGVTRTLARWPKVARAVGVDPSAIFINRARELSAHLDNIAFDQGDGCGLPFESEAFDVVVVHTTLSHIPTPELFLREAHRVLRPGGTLAVFDGDYATATVATGSFDPLESCIHAFRDGFVHDPWLMRRLPKALASAGFSVQPTRSHGYVEAQRGSYMLSLVDRGADLLVQGGRIDPGHGEALKGEARRRSEEREWFGHIAFASILGRKVS